MDITEQNAESHINFVPCLKWVQRGVAKANPEKVQLSKEELVQIINDTKSKLKTSEAEEASTSAPNNQENVERNKTNEDEFNLENYDDEEVAGLELLGIHNIAQLPTEADANFDDDDDDSEKEDDIIKPSDNLLLVGRVQGDASILEVHVYNESEGSLYCHHDLFLPAFPLCIEWLDFEPNQPQGNYCAIGSMNPIIDIWDLDVINCLEPAYSLGKSASKKRKTKAVGHTDAVLALSWNTHFHHILASGSVDETVLLWDIEAGTPSNTLKSFDEKVQCVNWQPSESHVLLTGSCDKTAKVFDCRSAEHKSWTFEGTVEQAIWSLTESDVFYIGTNDGKLHCLDTRKGVVWTVDAHDDEITGLSFSRQCPGMLASIAANGSLRIWDCKGNSKYGAQQVHQKDLKMGVLHCLEMCPDSAFVFAVGGDNKSNNLTVSNSFNYDPVKHFFASRPLLSSAVPSTEENMET